MENIKKTTNLNGYLVGIVAVLVLVSAIQIFQLNSIAASISSGALPGNADRSPSQSPLNLPSQVGGCG